MTAPKTLLELAGADLSPAKLSNAALVLIDIQNEYLSGPLALPGAEAAVEQAAHLLQAAREANTPVFHIAHRGRAGSLFDREAERGQIVDALTPYPHETVVEKGLPNAFAGTDLHARLGAAGRKDIILAGFMTHMCVSSTARAALDLGYRVTIDRSATGTRDLPDGQGGALPASTVHAVALAELSDRFAIIAKDWRAFV
jgi:nicotinamidase-related amidase